MKKTTALFKALAHDTRLKILNLLFDGEVCVCRIMEILELPQSTASRHLGILKNAGLVEDRREGIWVHYSLAQVQTTVARQILDVLEAHLGGIDECRHERERLPKTRGQQKLCS
jgi:ArsR family transcriptional regulator